MLDPPVDRDVIDRDTTLGEQLLDITVGQPVPQYYRTATEITSRGNRRPANAEGKDKVMRPVWQLARPPNATEPWRVVCFGRLVR